ncbi:hypothetical protein B0H10DRAFT_2209665 [Mycena sp. CBHHK59/15]|nr:hypothetical protein B0H10DRAFT_2209665 [Mycena sp. CBHHK59/15]
MHQAGLASITDSDILETHENYGFYAEDDTEVIEPTHTSTRRAALSISNILNPAPSIIAWRWSIASGFDLIGSKNSCTGPDLLQYITNSDILETHENYGFYAEDDTEVIEPTRTSTRRAALSISNILNSAPSIIASDSGNSTQSDLMPSIPLALEQVQIFGDVTDSEIKPAAIGHSSTDSESKLSPAATKGPGESTIPGVQRSVVSIPAPSHRPAKDAPRKSNPSKRKHIAESDDEQNYSDEERECKKKLAAKTNHSKEVKKRAPRTTVRDRLPQLMADPHIVKLPSGAPKGTPHEVYCKCEPGTAHQLESMGEYILKNYIKHKEPILSNKASISAFFNRRPSVPKPPLTAPSNTSTKKTVVIANQCLDASTFNSVARPLERATAITPRAELEEEVECLGLHGVGYQQYAWQISESHTGGVSATEWVRIAHSLFPYKSWSNDSSSSDSDASDSADTPDELPQKIVCDACALTTAVKLAMEGIPAQTNKSPQCSQWTEYKKGHLHQSFLVAARWIVYANTGSVFAKGCHRVTTNLTHTWLGKSSIAARRILKADIKAAHLHSPNCSEHVAANAKASLDTPAVMKILSSKAKYGPAGMFLSLYQQVLHGDLDDQETFVAISGQLTEKVERNKDPTGRAIHGIHYDPLFVKYCTLM